MLTKKKLKTKIIYLGTIAAAFIITAFFASYLPTKVNNLARSNFKSGAGTADDPFIVSTIEEFNAVNTRLDAYFVQIANLDFSGVEFHPIGDLTHPFTGNYDGRQFCLSGITADFSDRNNISGDNIGVFSFVYGGAVIKNVRVENSSFSGRYNVGAITGSSAGRIEGCYANATVNAVSGAGAVAGNNTGVISLSVNAGNITAINMYAGGIAGINYGKISDSYNQGNISAETYAGGIVAVNNGRDTAAVIEKVFNVGEISGNVKGNIAGDNLQGVIKQGRFIEDTEIKYAAAFNTGDVLATLARPAYEFKVKTAFSDWANFDNNFMFLKDIAHPILKVEYVKVSEIKFSVGTIVKLMPGEELNVGAYVMPSHATVNNVTLKAEAGVDSCSLGNGTIKINEDAMVGTKISLFGEADGVVGLLKIEVVKIPVQSVKIVSAENRTTIVPGGRLQLGVKFMPLNASIKEVKYGVSSPFADIDCNGILRLSLDAPEGLEFVVTAAAYCNINIRDEFKVTVVGANVKSVEVTNNLRTFKVTENLKLTGLAVTESLTTNDVVFKVLEEGTTADGARIVNGMLEANGTGKIRVVSEYKGFISEAVTFTVLAEPVISLEFLNKNLFPKNDALSILVKVLPENATYNNVSFSIAGPNNVGARLSGNILTAEKTGIVTVQAEAGGKYAEQTIYIESESLNNIEITDINLAADEFLITRSLILQAVLSPMEATGNVYFEIINDGGTLAIINNGVLTAERPGKIYIKAYTANFSKTLTVEALKVSVERIEFDNTNRFKITGGLSLNAVVFPINATNSNMTYEIVSSTASGAVINGNILTAKSVGTIIIRAKADGVYSDEFKVYADKEPVTDVQLTSTDRSFKYTESFKLTAIALPIQATYKNIEFFVSSDRFETTVLGAEIINGNILIINKNTNLSNSIGIVTIIMRCDGRDYKVVIVVEKEPVLEIADLQTRLISDNPNETEFRTGGVLDLTAVIYPDNATFQGVTIEIFDDGGTSALLIDEKANQYLDNKANVNAKENGKVFLTASKPGTITIRVTSLDNPAIFKDYTIIASEEYVTDIYFALTDDAEVRARDNLETIKPVKTIDTIDGQTYYYYDEIFLRAQFTITYSILQYAANRVYENIVPTFSGSVLYYYTSYEDFLANQNRKTFEGNPYIIKEPYLTNRIGEFGSLRATGKLGVIWLAAVSEHGESGDIISSVVKITINPENISTLKNLFIDNDTGIIMVNPQKEITTEIPSNTGFYGYEVIVKSSKFEFTKIINTTYLQLQLKLYKYNITSYDVKVNILYDYDPGTDDFGYRFNVPTDSFKGIKTTVPSSQFTTPISGVKTNLYNVIIVYDLYCVSEFSFAKNMEFDSVKYMYIYGNPNIRHNGLNFIFNNASDNDAKENKDSPIEITLHNIKFKANNNRDAIRINGNGKLTLNVFGQVELYGGDGDSGANGANGYTGSSRRSTSNRSGYELNGRNWNVQWNPFGENPDGEKGGNGGTSLDGVNGARGIDGRNGGFAIRLQGGGSFVNNSDKIICNIAAGASLKLTGGKGGNGGNGGNGDNGQGGQNGGNGGNGGTKYCIVFDLGGKGGDGGNGSNGGKGGNAGNGGNAGRGGLGINSNTLLGKSGVTSTNGGNGTEGVAGTAGSGGLKGYGGSGGSGGLGFYMVVIVPVFYTGDSGKKGNDGKDGDSGSSGTNGSLKELSNLIDVSGNI